MIYAVNYPPGGFGHFINAVITLHGDNFECIEQPAINFSAVGDAHSFKETLPTFFHNPKTYNHGLLIKDKNYTVLVDNGNDESIKFMDFFDKVKVIKIVYNSQSWPIIASSSVIKALNTTLEAEVINHNVNRWTDDECSAREAYFLYLKECDLQHKWTSFNNHDVDIADMLSYKTLVSKLESYGIVLGDFKELHSKWLAANNIYISPVINAEFTVSQIKNKISDSLHMFDTVWSQAVLYYFLWLEFKVEPPHNDWTDFVQSTDEIINWLEDLGKL